MPQDYFPAPRPQEDARPFIIRYAARQRTAAAALLRSQRKTLGHGLALLLCGGSTGALVSAAEPAFSDQLVSALAVLLKQAGIVCPPGTVSVWGRDLAFQGGVYAPSVWTCMLLAALALTALSCVPFLRLPSLHLAAHGGMAGVLLVWYVRRGLLLEFVREIAVFEVLFLPCMLPTYLVWRELSQAATDLALGRKRGWSTRATTGATMKSGSFRKCLRIVWASRKWRFAYSVQSPQ